MREKLIELVSDLYGVDPMYFGVDAPAIADHLIANGVTFATDNNVGSKWIPVTERLPEGSGKYLCNVKSCLFRGATYQMILGHDKGGFYDGCIGMDDVTHWMPLPEPPKEDTNG